MCIIVNYTGKPTEILYTFVSRQYMISSIRSVIVHVKLGYVCTQRLLGQIRNIKKSSQLLLLAD